MREKTFKQQQHFCKQEWGKRNLPLLYPSACRIYQEQFINIEETEEKLISFQFHIREKNPTYFEGKMEKWELLSLRSQDLLLRTEMRFRLLPLDHTLSFLKKKNIQFINCQKGTMAAS